MGREATLISRTLTSAETFVGDVAFVPFGTRQLTAEAIFTRAGGGTTCDVFLQTTLNGGTTWIDIAQWAFVTTTASRVHGVRADIALGANYTPTDGSLADNTIKDGLMGDRIRVKIVVVGTYTGASSIVVSAVPN